MNNSNSRNYIPFGTDTIFCTGPLIHWTIFSYVSINILEPLWKGGQGETMSERRHWKAEEKLALINEIRNKGHVVETCRKYRADPTMFYRWKESYETFGMEGLRSCQDR